MYIIQNILQFRYEMKHDCHNYIGIYNMYKMYV